MVEEIARNRSESPFMIAMRRLIVEIEQSRSSRDKELQN
jgi:hypothetical protein